MGAGNRSAQQATLHLLVLNPLLGGAVAITTTRLNHADRAKLQIHIIL
jgi:hypothetical protein